MRTEAEKTKIKWFMGGLAFIALLINSYFYRPASFRQPAYQQVHQSYQPQGVAAASGKAANDAAATRDDAAAARQAAERAAAEHARYLARYVNAPPSRKAGFTTMAVSIVSENGKYNRALNTAVSSRFKADMVEMSPSLFTPEFVSEGLFRGTFSDPNKIIRQLELANSLDVLLLAQEQVQYSQNPGLDNVMTANMQLDMLLLPTAEPDQSVAWTLSANGAGFTEKEARAMAEERLIKQISTDPKLSLTQISKNN